MRSANERAAFTDGDSIKARRHVTPHFFRAEGTQWSVPPHFWTENIRHAHIEPYPRHRQNLFRFQSRFNSHVAEAGINNAGNGSTVNSSYLAYMLS